MRRVEFFRAKSTRCRTVLGRKGTLVSTQILSQRPEVKADTDRILGAHQEALPYVRVNGYRVA